jgi:SAM-dependent methyltransferase
MHAWKHAPLAALAAALLVPACHRPTTAVREPAEPADPVALGEHGAPARAPDVIWVPTPDPIVEEMLNLAKVKPGDVVYDLGCGDGRIVIAAARRGAAKAVGVDIDPQRIAEARENARQAGLADRVTFIEGDLFQVDFSDADVVTLYLLDEINLRLRPKILALRPGTRVVSHSFDMGDWKPEATEIVDGKEIFAWTVPEHPQRAQGRAPPAR